MLYIIDSGLLGSISFDSETSSSIIKQRDRDGCDCIKCKNFYPYAEPNQKDGTLICFGCRMEW